MKEISIRKLGLQVRLVKEDTKSFHYTHASFNGGKWIEKQGGSSRDVFIFEKDIVFKTHTIPELDFNQCLMEINRWRYVSKKQNYYPKQFLAPILDCMASKKHPEQSWLVMPYYKRKRGMRSNHAAEIVGRVKAQLNLSDIEPYDCHNWLVADCTGLPVIYDYAL